MITQFSKWKFWSQLLQTTACRNSLPACAYASGIASRARRIISRIAMAIGSFAPSLRALLLLNKGQHVRMPPQQHEDAAKGREASRPSRCFATRPAGPWPASEPAVGARRTVRLRHLRSPAKSVTHLLWLHTENPVVLAKVEVLTSKQNAPKMKPPVAFSPPGERRQYVHWSLGNKRYP